jgi:hypothetical protein
VPELVEPEYIARLLIAGVPLVVRIAKVAAPESPGTPSRT